MARRVRHSVRMLAVVVLALMGSAVPTELRAAAPGPPLNDESVLDGAAVFGQSETIADRFSRAFGDRFVTFWIGRSTAPSSLVVRLRGATERDLAAARNAVDGGRDRVRVVTGRLSATQIGRIRDRLFAVLLEAQIVPAQLATTPPSTASRSPPGPCRLTCGPGSKPKQTAHLSPSKRTRASGRASLISLGTSIRPTRRDSN